MKTAELKARIKKTREPLKNVGGEALARRIWARRPHKKADDCREAGGRAMQEQLPSLHEVNEHVGGTPSPNSTTPERVR